MARQPVSSAVLLAVPTVMWCADLRGGMGVEENIVTLCDKCHYAFDEGLFMDRASPVGI